MNKSVGKICMYSYDLKWNSFVGFTKLLSSVFACITMNLIVRIIAIVVIGISFIVSMILLCLSLMEKEKLKTYGIGESRIRKIVTLSICSLVIAIISCIGCTFMIFLVLALVFANSKAKADLQAQNSDEAFTKANRALVMLIICNSIIVGMSVLFFTMLKIIK